MILQETHLNYPSHWWTPVDDPNAPDWEVLPQAAGPGEVILSKRNELGCLSNFAPTPFTFREKTYASIEGWWFAMFYPENDADPRAQYPGLKWRFTRDEVSNLSGFEAWNAGESAVLNMKTMGIPWITFQGDRMDYWIPTKGRHYDLVVEALWAKLNQNAIVRKTLLSTGNLKLRPDYHEPLDAPPSWKHYLIWMEIRSHLNQEFG